MHPWWWSLLWQVTWRMCMTSINQAASSPRSVAPYPAPGIIARYPQESLCTHAYHLEGTRSCACDLSLCPLSFPKSACHCYQVDGQLSITCYLQAIDRCYSLLRQKIDRHSSNLGMAGQPFSLRSVAYCIMHVRFFPILMRRC